MRVIVVGGGIHGQASAYSLIREGARVTVVEPVGPGSHGSGSGDRTRIVRAMYAEPKWARSGFDSLALWESWSTALGVRLWQRTGVLYLDSTGEDSAGLEHRASHHRAIANVRALGGEVIELDPDELARRYPAISIDGVRGAALEVGAGMGFAARATRALARASLELGATHVGEEVVELVVEGGAAVGVRLASGEALRADRVIVAAGLVGAELVESALARPGALGLRRLPHFTSYWDIPYPEGALLHVSRLPAWTELGAGLYGFPDDGESGFKAALHLPRATETPEVSDDEIELVRVAVSRRFPAMEKATLRGVYPCAYDTARGERLVAGPVPGLTNLFLLGGMSGHGYKHAPALGVAAARWALGRPLGNDMSPFAVRLAGSTNAPPPSRSEAPPSVPRSNPWWMPSSQPPRSSAPTPAEDLEG